MLKSDCDPASVHEISNKRYFSRGKRGSKVTLEVLFSKPQSGCGWAKLGHICDYVFPCQGFTTVRRKGKFQGKIKEGYTSETKCFLPKAESLAGQICQHVGFLWFCLVSKQMKVGHFQIQIFIRGEDRKKSGKKKEDRRERQYVLSRSQRKMINHPRAPRMDLMAALGTSYTLV